MELNMYILKIRFNDKDTETVFVRADLKGTIEKYIMLGTEIHKTVISKWLSNQGLLMSTSYLMEGIPNIVVIDDLEKKQLLKM